MTAPQQPWAQTPRSEEENAEGRDQHDERLTRSGAPEVRGDYSIRQDAERAQMPNLSDDELEQLIQSEYENSGLASPPPIPGFHLCWLTTSSQYDTIQRRQRVGYQPVMRSEMPGFDPSNGAALENYEGMVTCNELILHKIEVRRYQVMMNMFHHKKPLATESTILKAIKDGDAKAEGVNDDSGISTLERSVKVGASLPEQSFS
jgi:hypothetical protein